MRSLICAVRKKEMIYLLVAQVLIVHAQLNIYWRNENGMQHDCLRMAKKMNEWKMINREIISFCLSESTENFHIDQEDVFPKFTFADLWNEQITTEQLYHWSVPIDIIERYQTKDMSLSNEMIYNCSWPRFGSYCQYEIDHDHGAHSTLHEIITSYYRTYPYHPSTLTCYEHLSCDRGPGRSCLDWSEICDGKIDCLVNGIDEESCWLLEINQCETNEYRCRNGQCIPQAFYRDHSNVFDCLDASDEIRQNIRLYQSCEMNAPSLACEDLTCASTFLSPSCVYERTSLLMDEIYLSNDSSVSEPCWSAFRCILDAPNPNREFCANNSCLNIVDETCPEMILMPNIPVLFGEIYFAYTKNESAYLAGMGSNLVYLCYQNSTYDEYFKDSPKIVFNNLSCYRGQQPEHLFINSPWTELLSKKKYDGLLNGFDQKLRQYHFNFNYSSTMCYRSNMYQCLQSSKCISIDRLLDANNDCPLADDEDLSRIDRIDLIKRIKETYFHCESLDTYMSPTLTNDGTCDCRDKCRDLCVDEDLNRNFIRKNISFQTICDGFVELVPMNINGRDYTDESECEQWQCDNIYTHCNGIWNCPNGLDEIGCDAQPLINCPSNHHYCVSPSTNQLTCLSVDKANDGHVDCIGGTDEPNLCAVLIDQTLEQRFYCRAGNVHKCLFVPSLCNGREDCDQGADEQFCTGNRSSPWTYITRCVDPSIVNATNSQKFLCRLILSRITKQPIIYFSLDRQQQQQQRPSVIADPPKTFPMQMTTSSSPRRCHRGLDVRVWLNNQNQRTTLTCFCPSSFYGDQCQYQNQRISLSMQFHTLSDSRHTLFAIVVSLIEQNDERTIHSFEQFTYLSVRDCLNKFQVNLLYAIRSKNLTKQYFVQLDIYEKVSLFYRGSFLFLVKFSFLPVYRLALIVNIPHSDQLDFACSFDRCIHGRCIKYRNNGTSFCQCHTGWSGQFCSIAYRCTCAPNALCLGIDAQNRSICLCPKNQFGPRCLLIDRICEKNFTCANGGQCIPNDNYQFSLDRQYICICPKGFSGDRCETIDRQLILSFAKDIDLSSSIFIHFIQVFPDQAPVQSTNLRTIPRANQSIIIYRSQPYHLVFIELLDRTYYLSPIEQKSYQSSTIHPSHRCPNISELFNETFSQMHLLHRIKFYHLPCENLSLNLACFYDDVHLCLCYSFHGKRLANCFRFHHHQTFDCFGQSECENHGQCFQDTRHCPQRSICICPRCFYGTRCQFDTHRFSLSLDAILGYHILPHMPWKDQPSIVKFSFSLMIILVVLGLINGILSLMTFKDDIVREVGCGWYLLGASWTTLLGMIIFGVKFTILLCAQMAMISDRLFLQIQCISLDFLLGICLTANQWFDACVAMERAITVVKGTRFVKQKSKKIAQIVSIILLIFVTATSAHDPISRRLFTEQINDDEIRIWCIVTFPIQLQIFNTAINLFHFITPLLINLVSAVILLRTKSRQQVRLQSHRTYGELLRRQLREHQHLFTAPVLLVILAVPRLIISLLSKCMTSSRESWLFLAGYFISFIPSVLTFVLFVLPSKFYKKQFRKTFEQYRRRLYTIRTNFV